jgi:hypothetical protein
MRVRRILQGRLTIAAIFPFLGKVFVIEGDLKNGAVFEFLYEFGNPYAFRGELNISQDPVLTPAVWPESAIQNRPGYAIDNFCLGKTGKVRVVDSGNSESFLQVTIAKNGVVFAK